VSTVLFNFQSIWKQVVRANCIRDTIRVDSSTNELEQASHPSVINHRRRGSETRCKRLVEIISYITIDAQLPSICT
jgi:hypothetical protein